jgi:hypothetical protein
MKSKRMRFQYIQYKRLDMMMQSLDHITSNLNNTFLCRVNMKKKTRTGNRPASLQPASPNKPLNHMIAAICYKYITKLIYYHVNGRRRDVIILCASSIVCNILFVPISLVLS